MKVALSCLLIAFAISGNAGFQTYEGYKVLRTYPTTAEQASALNQFVSHDYEFDLWNDAKIERSTDIMAPSHRVAELTKFLQSKGISFSTMINNVGTLVTKERARLAARKAETQAMTWEDYNDIDTIYQWLDNLALVYPDLVTVSTFGQSYNGQDMKMVKISTGGTGKPAFLIDSAIHAREWIAPATATYMMNEIITRPNQYWDIVDNFDFYFIPVLNPDGYRHSFDSERLWRKSRSDNGSPIGCLGVDINRNFDFEWNSCPGCSSGDPCSQTYRGPAPFSESEGDAMRAFVEDNAASVNWQYYVSIHSYSQMFLTPWGYTGNLPPQYDEIKLAADYFAGNLTAMYGTDYLTGPSHDVIYPTDGSTADWAKANGFKYSYTAELRDKGAYGFLLPPEQIMPTAEETWAGLQAMARHFLATEV